MAYQKPEHVRQKMAENIRRDLGVSKARARELAEGAVRRSSEQIEKQVKDGTRSAT